MSKTKWILFAVAVYVTVSLTYGPDLLRAHASFSAWACGAACQQTECRP